MEKSVYLSVYNWLKKAVNDFETTNFTEVLFNKNTSAERQRETSASGILILRLGSFCPKKYITGDELWEFEFSIISNQTSFTNDEDKIAVASFLDELAVHLLGLFKNEKPLLEEQYSNYKPIKLELVDGAENPDSSDNIVRYISNYTFTYSKKYIRNKGA